jgi:hypothetical protein
MAVDLLAALKAGLAEGDLRAVRIFFDAAGLGTRKFDPDRLLAYAEKRGRSPYQIARLLISNRNPRDWDYLRKARSVAKFGWRRYGLKEEEAVDLVNEALASRWHVKHGLEYRFLVALLHAPEAIPEALTALASSDFVNACYAALFESLRRHGIPPEKERDGFLAPHVDAPAMPRCWWESEARGTLSAMLVRRDSWFETRARGRANAARTEPVSDSGTLRPAR